MVVVRRAAFVLLIPLFVGHSLWAFEPQNRFSLSAPSSLRPLGTGAKDYFLRRYPLHLWQGARKAFWGKNLLPLTLAGGLAAGFGAGSDGVDEDIREYFQHDDPLGGVSDVVEEFGHSGVQFGLPLLVYTAGKWRHSPKLVDTSEIMLEAVSLANLTGYFLKLTTQRERPDGSNQFSFPSGHAYGTFAIAAVLQKAYNWRVGLPSYLAAGLVSLSRVQEDKHFLSDSIFGAVLGTIIGYEMHRVHAHSGPPKFSLRPVISPRHVGFQLVTYF